MCQSSEFKRASLCKTDSAKVSPVQQVTEALCAVPLNNTLSAALLTELEEEGGQLVTRLIHATIPPV